MADYFTPTVIQPAIPAADITPLERLLLSHVINAEPDGGHLYFYADEGPADTIWFDRAPVDKMSDKAPDHQVDAGQRHEIGAGWSQVAKSSGETYLNLKIGAPEFGPNSVRCRLVKLEQPAEDGATHIARLIDEWSWINLSSVRWEGHVDENIGKGLTEHMTVPRTICKQWRTSVGVYVRC